jgi:hypothetical protein
MNKLHYISFICTFVCLIFASCEKDDEFLSQDNAEEQEISVTSEGYLNFATESSFENFITQLQDEEEGTGRLRSAAMNKIDGFASIAD